MKGRVRGKWDEEREREKWNEWRKRGKWDEGKEGTGKGEKR